MKKGIFLIFIGTMLVVLSACSSNAIAPATEAVVDQEKVAITEVVAAESTQESQSPVQEGATQTVGQPVSFQTDVMPVLQGYCANCHGIERVSRGLDLQTYASTMKGSQNGAMVIPGDALNSPLVKSILSGKMPKKGPKPSEADVDLLIRWIDQGALDN